MFDDHHHELEASEINHSHADKSEDHEMDCHHCCHCHGHLSPAILIKSLGFTLNKSPTSLLDYSESFSSEIINPLLRPPIAHT